MVSNIAGGSGVLQDVLNGAGAAANDLLRAGELTGWIRPSLIGAESSSFLPTLSREAQQAASASAYANAANAARANDISAWTAQAQNRLGELNLLGSLRGPKDAIAYNYMLNRVGAPAGQQAQGQYLAPLAPQSNPLSGFTAGAIPGQVAAPKLQPNMGIPNTPAQVAQRPATPPVAPPMTPSAQMGPGSGLPAYLLPQGDPQAPAAQDRFQQGLQDGSINIVTQEEEVQQHQEALQEAAQQFQEEHGRAPENWEVIAQEYENRGYDIPGFAMGTMGQMGGVRDPLALVGDERGGKPELLVNHGDGSFDILNNKTTQRLIDSGMIEKMDMSEYKDGTRKISLRLGRKVAGYEDGTSAGKRGIPGVSDRVDWRYMDPRQREAWLQEMYARMAMGMGGAGAVTGPIERATQYAGAAKAGMEATPPRLVEGARDAGMGLLGGVARLGAVPAYADGTGGAFISGLPAGFSRPPDTYTTGVVPTTNTGGWLANSTRPFNPAQGAQDVLGNTTYDQNAIAGLPAIQELTGQMPSKGAWGTGLDMRIPGTNTQLPGMINTTNFMRQAPSERALIESVYSTPVEMGGLGIDWADIVEMSKRTSPIGTGLQTMATYGR